MSSHREIMETVAAVRDHYPESPRLGLILGSGLGAIADDFLEKKVVPFGDLPHFPHSTAPGHSGNLVLGIWEGVRVAAMQGRVHFYEGYRMDQVVYPTRVLAGLGIRRLIVTNAAGGINTEFQPGDLMIIRDHINLMGTNPLIGANPDAMGPRFPDMSQAYDLSLQEVAGKAAADLGLAIRSGVYVGLSGPSYETPAEIRMLRTMGGDAVGMSTVPEVIVANHMGVRVLGISCITNMAAGILPQKLTHQEVMDTTARIGHQFIALLRKITSRIDAVPSSDL